MPNFSSFIFYPNIIDEKLLFSYRGPITYPILAEIAEEIKEYFKFDPRIGYKMFGIFMEMGQNLFDYSQEFNIYHEKPKVGSIFIGEDEGYYSIATGNLLDAHACEHICEKCKIINTLDIQGLRQYKRKLRSISALEVSQPRAGIGLVQTAILSENSIVFDFENVNHEYRFLILYTKVAKSSPNPSQILEFSEHIT
jgi:Family of unknown function (DUF6272)